MIFILGKSPKHLESEITTEATRFDDMVQEDFADTFVNLTLKATFMLKWITSNHCLNTAKFLFKADDDTFVNPQQLWASLGIIHILRKHIVGRGEWPWSKMVHTKLKFEPFWIGLFKAWPNSR